MFFSDDSLRARQKCEVRKLRLAQAALKAEKSESVRVGATVRSLDRASAEAFGLDFADLRLGESVVLAAFSQEWLVRMIFAGAGSLVIEEPQEIRLLFRQSIDATMALYE